MSDADLWAFVAQIPTDDDLRRALEKMPRAQMSRIFRALLDARTDLIDRLVASGRASDASEDVLDDLAECVLLGGKAHYDGVLNGDIPLPPREQWHSQRAVSWLFDEAFHRRFGGGILDDFD
jgi:hypothetical protein